MPTASLRRGVSRQPRDAAFVRARVTGTYFCLVAPAKLLPVPPWQGLPAALAVRTPNISRMSGGIFLLRGEDELVEMRESAYEAEDVLQALIARFPSLLAGDQYSGGTPRRWLLVGREASLPDDEDASGRWSVDHLFLDQDAVPTLVEVKRSSDTRIRREVVGQMLDYAANGVVYWPLEQLREFFARQCERDGSDPDVVMADVAGDETDVQEFWARVGDNLRAGKIRMVFVSDEIPRELRRVVEFLNGQMNPAEVIAIEVKQYLGADGTRTLVPRVIGQTAEVEARKGLRAAGQRRQWDEQSLFALLLQKRGPDETRVARDLYDWARTRGWRSTFGAGKQDGSWIPVMSANDQGHWPIAVYTYGKVEIQFQHLKVKAPFDAEGTRLELLRRVNEIPGVSFGSDVITRRPAIQLDLLVENPAALAQLKRVLEWVEAEAGKAH
jgi:hypothetical protein